MLVAHVMLRAADFFCSPLPVRAKKQVGRDARKEKNSMRGRGRGRGGICKSARHDGVLQGDRGRGYIPGQEPAGPGLGWPMYGRLGHYTHAASLQAREHPPGMQVGEAGDLCNTHAMPDGVGQEKEKNLLCWEIGMQLARLLDKPQRVMQVVEFAEEETPQRK